MQHQKPSQSEVDVFCQSAQNGDDKAVLSMIEQHGTAIIDAPASRDGFTALMYAVYARHSSTVELLLEKKADPNAIKRSHNLTPLHIAARRGYASIAALLLKYGADPEIKDSDGKTANDIALEHKQTLAWRVLDDAMTKQARHNRATSAKEALAIAAANQTRLAVLKTGRIKVLFKGKQ